MVVTPEHSRFNDENVSYDEERTYREAIKSLRLVEHDLYGQRLIALDAKVDAIFEQIKTSFEATATERKRLQELFDEKLLRVDSISKETNSFVREEISKLSVAVAEDVVNARITAQTANDALQRLLEAAMEAGNKMADSRFTGQESAITKTETAIVTAANTHQIAINAAKTSASAALAEVDQKAIMRHEAALSAVTATDQKTVERITALQRLIDLRAQMTEDAVTKANDANEKRFESVNEFRAQLSDQTRQFVTVPVLDARMSQLSTQTDTLDRQLRIDTLSLRDSLNLLSTRLTTREASDATKREVHTETHSNIGSVLGIVGGVVGVLSLMVAIGFGIMHQATPASSLALNPTIGADTQRVNDLVARFDALSNRMNQTPPK